MRNDFLSDEDNFMDISAVLAICVALCIAIFMGFVVGSQSLNSKIITPYICDEHLKGEKLEQCIALRSAKATEEATLTSKWMLWISAGSLLASASALAALIFAYKQGQHALAAARQSNSIADRNGQAQARAYVVLQSVGCRLSIETFEQIRLSVVLKFYNSGNSPARRLRHFSIAALSITNRDAKNFDVAVGEEFDLAEAHWRQDLPAGQSWSPIGVSWLLPKSAAIYRWLASEGTFNAVTVKTVFEYEDVFGVLHRETACFQGRVARGDPDAPNSELERGPDDIFDRHAAFKSHED